MKKQIYSDDYNDNIEIMTLLEEIDKRYQNENGYIFYGFPTIKEFDRPIIRPDIFIVAEHLGVVSILVDSIEVDRSNLFKMFLEKMDEVDNYIYTTLLRDKRLNNNRQLEFSVSTLGYCPNMLKEESSASIFVNRTSLLSKLEEISNSSDGSARTFIDTIISDLEGSGAIIKPKERVLNEQDIDTKANLLKEIEGRIARFDDEQRFSALSMLEGPQRIRGLAGSGKTIILCLKAAHLHMMHPNAIILYTFYTKSLYDYIVQLINRFYMKMTDGQVPDFNKIQILHAWGGAQVPGVYYEACKKNNISPLTLNDARGHGENPFSYICKQFIDDTKYNAIKMYDYVLIDEAQDFEAPFYQLCRSIVKDDHIVWCYDEVQNIFDVVIQNTKDTFSNVNGKP